MTSYHVCLFCLDESLRELFIPVMEKLNSFLWRESGKPVMLLPPHIEAFKVIEEGGRAQGLRRSLLPIRKLLVDDGYPGEAADSFDDDKELREDIKTKVLTVRRLSWAVLIKNLLGQVCAFCRLPIAVTDDGESHFPWSPFSLCTS